MQLYRIIAVYLAGYIFAFALSMGVVKDMGKWNVQYYKPAVAIIALLSWVIVIAIIIGVLTRSPKDQT